MPAQQRKTEPEPDANNAVQQALADLAARVENLERQTGTPAPAEVERDQAERDEEILSRPPTTYAEAVAQEQARKRHAERKGASTKDKGTSDG